MGKIKGLVTRFIKHWNHPGEGRYVSNKEICAYSVGGIGVMFIAAVVAQVILSANCLLLGSCYGMTPIELTILATVNTVFTIVVQPLKSYWIDNVGAKSNKQRGKARPFLLWLGAPSAILVTLFAFIPTTWAHNNHTAVVVIVGILFLAMSFIYQFFYGMYIQLSQLMSPNTTERADIISISSIVYSLAPTITGAVFPLIASAFDQGQRDINFYRIIFPVFAFIGLAISYIAYFGTKERIVVPKTYKAKVKFSDGFKKIMSNKYLWIMNLSTMFVFARGAITACQFWTYIYILQNEAIQSLVTLIIGTASGIGMAAAPFIIRAIGKKWATIVTNLMFAVSSFLLIFFNDNFIVFTIFCYFSFFGAAVQIITSPAMNAEALDYQQWKTGDRLEGFSGNFGIIVQCVALGTNFIIPAIYSYYGLSDNYDVLYDPAIRNPMFTALSILALVGALVCCIPYLFWDLNEKRHGQIIEDLKVRAIEANREAGLDDGSFLSSDETFEDLYQDELTTDIDGNAISVAEEVEEKIEEEIEEDSQAEQHTEEVVEAVEEVTEEAVEEAPIEEEKEEK